LALRTQQILAYEAGVTETPDPLAGSYFVETLTTQLEAAAQDYLDEIDALGGAPAAIAAGYQQRQIQEAAYRVQREIESEERIVVGVNRFRDDRLPSPELQRIDPAGEHEQVARLRQLRAERDGTAWTAALAQLEAAAAGDANLLPPIIAAVKARATLGEISDRLRSAWGEHRELITV
jgi:methylmalonyl-CoA mutase N-terminal domain/subunit